MSMGDQTTADRYRIIERIGEGVHGIVLRAVDQQLDSDQQQQQSEPEQRQVAIKKIALRNKYGDISLNAVREIKVLQHCDHPNILSLLDMFPDLSGIALVFDYIPNTLYSKMKDEELPLSRADIKSYTGQLLLGVEYMHGLGIMHRDIKPSNLLIDEADRLKIADFGLSRLFYVEQEAEQEVCYSPQVASRWYRAPELLWGSPKYGSAIDMWAVGCVFAEMLRGGNALFNGNTDIEQLAMVIKVLGSPSAIAWPEVKSLPDFKKIRFPETKREPWEQHFPATTKTSELNLVDQLIVYNPKKRFIATEALCSEYFL